MESLSKYTVVITGAGAGIGRALAQGFVRSGAYVLGIARHETGLQETQQSCDGPGHLETAAADVGNSIVIEAVLAHIISQRGSIDLLVNGACVYPHVLLPETEPEHWQDGVATNLNGVAFCCRAAVRLCPTNSPLLIFNIGSFAHLGPDPGSILYCTTKAAVSAFTRALAIELRATNPSIIVNEWVPGIYRTRMSHFKGEDPAVAFDRFSRVVQLARHGLGGRLFEKDKEVVPHYSLRSQIKSLILRR